MMFSSPRQGRLPAMRKTSILLLALVSLLALAGCEASVSTGGIDSDEVAEEAQVQLTKASEAEGGPAIPEVECPDDLDEEEGATMTCFTEYEGEKYDVGVEVTE